MAEVAGLILGSVALASLFKTCIELFECFELGRNYVYDYQLASTKLALLQARLRTWGTSLQIEKPGEEHPGLRQHWSEEQDIIGRSLYGIKEIFENASLLAEKYRLTPRHSRTFRPTSSKQPEDLQSSLVQTRSAQHSTTGWNFFRRRTIWAIHDKQRFDGFIQHLSFLIENLEKVTERMAMPTFEKPTAFKKQPQITEPNQKALVVAYTDDPPKERIRLPSPQPGQAFKTPPAHVYLRDQKVDVEAVAMQLDGAVFTGSQTADGGAAVMGNVGKSDKRRNLYTGNQKAINNGLTIMGNVEAKAAAYLQPSGQRRRKQKIPADRSDRSESRESSSDSSGDSRSIRTQGVMNLKLTRR